jgi:hypothetical protein
MSDWLGAKFRKLSWVVVLVGCLVTFDTLVFADVPTDRRGRPKPPLGRQLLQTGAVIAAGRPGSVWAAVRTSRGRLRTLWE